MARWAVLQTMQACTDSINGQLHENVSHCDATSNRTRYGEIPTCDTLQACRIMAVYMVSRTATVAWERGRAYTKGTCEPLLPLVDSVRRSCDWAPTCSMQARVTRNVTAEPVNIALGAKESTSRINISVMIAPPRCGALSSVAETTKLNRTPAGTCNGTGA